MALQSSFASNVSVRTFGKQVRTFPLEYGQGGTRAAGVDPNACESQDSDLKTIAEIFIQMYSDLFAFELRHLCAESGLF